MLRRTEMETKMLIKILAASTLALGLATSAAMAQTVVTDDGVYGGSTTTVVPDDTVVVDPGTTGSIYPDARMGAYGSPDMTTGNLGPCPSDWGSMGPDANASPGVNDKYCGK
jgi:hypothetical protein